jgi:acyl-CoA thioester hydrolase
VAQQTVLIIDDDQTLVAPLKEGLESLGYKVAVAFDAMQGILQAHQAKPDVIILDFNMPGGGGANVYDRLRQAPDTSAIPIVFSSVISAEELKGHVKPTGKTYFLRKPAGLNQFVGVLNQVLGRAAPAIETVPFAAVPPPPKTGGLQAPPPPAPAPKPAAPVKKTPKVHEFQVRVTYADTDKMGVIYYANYFRYFEQGRTELMRSLGLRYRDLEVQRKLFIPAVETGCKYLGPTRYDDLLIVRTWISSLGRASIAFEHEIMNKELGDKKIATGFSRHALVNDLWRTTKIPEDLKTLLEPYVAEDQSK